MIFGLDAWIFWLIVAAVMIIIEACTVNLVSIWFALGALGAMVTDLCGGSVPLQIIIAAVICIVTLVLVLVFKPFDKWKHKKAQATNSDRVIGQQALVIKSIDPIEGSGLVKVMGQIWSAVSSDGSLIKEGELVNVTAIKGVKLIVELPAKDI